MRTYIADEYGVVVIDILLAVAHTKKEISNKELREFLREDLREQFGGTHVWFEDERGSRLDQVCGPYPVYGPTAELLSN